MYNPFLTKAIEAARDILNKHYKNKSPKVNPTTIAAKLGVSVKNMSFANDKISGLLKKKDSTGKPIIVVNENHPEPRKRFTIAHELGHYILHASSPLYVDDVSYSYFRNEESSQANKIQEMQANRFAAELLMPYDKVLADAKRLNFENTDKAAEVIAELADKYHVSQQAMTIRLGQLMH